MWKLIWAIPSQSSVPANPCRKQENPLFARCLPPKAGGDLQGRPSPCWRHSMGCPWTAGGDGGCCCGGPIPAAHHRLRGSRNSCFLCHHSANACDVWSQWGPGRDGSLLLLWLQDFAVLSQRRRKRALTSRCSHGALQGFCFSGVSSATGWSPSRDYGGFFLIIIVFI